MISDCEMKNVPGTKAYSPLYCINEECAYTANPETFEENANTFSSICLSNYLIRAWSYERFVMSRT